MEPFEKETNSDIFTKIYQENRWGDGIEIPKSGVGSLPSNAEMYVKFVEKIVSDFSIESVVDVGHGDWSMWKDYKFENVNYFGIDVARGLSELVSSQYGNPNRIFKFADGVNSSLPSGDLLMCKDVLQHLPNQSVIDFLNVCKNYKYVILSNDIVCYSLINILKIILARIDPINRAVRAIRFKNPFYKTYRHGNNYDISPGSGRGLDFSKDPFRESFSNFKVISTFDYFVGKQGISVNRVYLLTSFNQTAT